MPFLLRAYFVNVIYSKNFVKTQRVKNVTFRRFGEFAAGLAVHQPTEMIQIIQSSHCRRRVFGLQFVHLIRKRIISAKADARLGQEGVEKGRTTYAIRARRGGGETHGDWAQNVRVEARPYHHQRRRTEKALRKGIPVILPGKAGILYRQKESRPSSLH